MGKRIGFGVRLKRVVSTNAPNDQEVHFTPYERVSWPTVRLIAEECDVLGFDSLIVPDHVMTTGPMQFGCWSILSALAACTKRVTLGTLTVNSMRYLPCPSLFAKEVATLDNISDGRLYPLGLGAGWNGMEYRAFGIPFPPHKTRIDQLEETIQIMNAMFTEETATFKGKHFNIQHVDCEPKPVQKPFPICIGGVGKRILRLAAKYADYVDISSEPAMGRTYALNSIQKPSEEMPETPPPADEATKKRTLQERLDWVKECCAEFGRNYDDIVKAASFKFYIYKNEKELARHEREFKRLAGTQGAHLTMGTPDEIIDFFEERVKMGVTYFTLRWEDLPSTSGLRLFAKEVIPHFR